MPSSWFDRTNHIKTVMRDLRADAPEVMKAFSALAQSALATKALDPKTKELIALAISVAIRFDDCIGFHVKAAIEAGATRAEVTEALAMAVYMGAGPSVMYATHALDAFQEFDAVGAQKASA